MVISNRLVISKEVQKVFNDSIISDDWISNMILLEEYDQTEIDDEEYMKHRLTIWLEYYIETKLNIEFPELLEEFSNNCLNVDFDPLNWYNINIK